MKRHPGLTMVLVTAGVLLLGAALAGCAPDKTAPTLVPQPQPETNQELDDPADAVLEDATPVDEPVDGLEDDSPSVATQVEFTDLVCLDCHSNQELLQDLAVEDVDAGESLSEGPG